MCSQMSNTRGGGGGGGGEVFLTHPHTHISIFKQILLNKVLRFILECVPVNFKMQPHLIQLCTLNTAVHFISNHVTGDGKYCVKQTIIRKCKQRCSSVFIQTILVSWCLGKIKMKTN